MSTPPSVSPSCAAWRSGMSCGDEADPAADHAALRDEVGEHAAHHVHGDREADALDAEVLGDDGRVDADERAAGIHQRAAGVADVDRRVGLDEVLEAPRRPSCWRPVALTMPCVTVWDRPMGLPMASTTSPTRSRSERPSGATGSERRPMRSTARSVSGIAADDGRIRAAPVGELYVDRVGVRDDVVVRDDVALRRRR